MAPKKVVCVYSYFHFQINWEEGEENVILVKSLGQIVSKTEHYLRLCQLPDLLQAVLKSCEQKK